MFLRFLWIPKDLLRFLEIYEEFLGFEETVIAVAQTVVVDEDNDDATPIDPSKGQRDPQHETNTRVSSDPQSRCRVSRAIRVRVR